MRRLGCTPDAWLAPFRASRALAGAPHALASALRQLRRQAAGMVAACCALAVLAALPAALGQATPVAIAVSTATNPAGSATSPQYIGVNHGARRATCRRHMRIQGLNARR